MIGGNMEFKGKMSKWDGFDILLIVILGLLLTLIFIR